MATQQTGKVKTFDANRGYGFIASDDDSEDLYFRAVEILDRVQALSEDQAVSFVVVDGKKA